MRQKNVNPLLLFPFVSRIRRLLGGDPDKSYSVCDKELDKQAGESLQDCVKDDVSANEKVTVIYTDLVNDDGLCELSIDIDKPRAKDGGI